MWSSVKEFMKQFSLYLKSCLSAIKNKMIRGFQSVGKSKNLVYQNFTSCYCEECFKKSKPVKVTPMAGSGIRTIFRLWYYKFKTEEWINHRQTDFVVKINVKQKSFIIPIQHNSEFPLL